ncbi:hypothetical protein MNEG_6985, partial [Monoraphidium neglectum]
MSMSVSLLLLPWAARHPTFLIGLPLLACTPVVGQGVRPLLREALAGLFKGLRLSSNWLLPHPEDAHAHHGAGHHGHGHSAAAAAHHGGAHAARGAAHHRAAVAPRKAVDPRTAPHGPGAGGAAPFAEAAAGPYQPEPYIQPSGPYS